VRVWDAIVLSHSFSSWGMRGVKKRRSKMKTKIRKRITSKIKIKSKTAEVSLPSYS
jgi:hypothetical protein